MVKRPLLLAALLLWLVIGGCGPEAEWTDLRRGATDCVVAVFPTGTTAQEINAFLEEHTQGPPHPGGGHLLRPGIGAVINTDVDGQDAYQICFQSDADPEQTRTIREAIKNSPVVERVLEGEEAEPAVSGRESS